MTQLNVNNLLSALAPQINPSLGGQVGGESQSDPAQFLNLLAGLVIGSQSKANMGVSCEDALPALKDGLTDEDLNFIAGLMAGGELAEAAPAVISFNKGDKIFLNGLKNPENVEGNEEKSNLSARLFGISEAILNQAAITVENSSEDPVETVSPMITDTMLSGASENGMEPAVGNKQVAAAMEIASVSDLENLQVGEKLTVSEADENGRIEKVSFLKSDQPQVFNDKNFQKFEIEVISDNKISRFDAVLVKPEGNAQKTVADLAAMLPENSAKDARLMLIYSNSNPAGFDSPIEQKNGGLIESGAQPIRVVGDDATVQLRQLELKEENAARTAEKNVIEENESKNQDIFKPIAGSDGKSETRQSMQNQSQDLSGSLKFARESLKISGAETFAEKLGEMQSNSSQSQAATEVSRISDSDAVKTVKDNFQFRNVEFKLEPPSGGTKIPENGYFRIKLEPESLGKIDVELKIEHDRLIANLKVESPLARQVVEASLPQLKESLQSQGIKVDGFTVDLNSGGFNQNPGSRQASENSQKQNRFGGRMADISRVNSIDAGTPKLNGILNLKGKLSLLA